MCEWTEEDERKWYLFWGLLVVKQAACALDSKLLLRVSEISILKHSFFHLAVFKLPGREPHGKFDWLESLGLPISDEILRELESLLGQERGKVRVKRTQWLANERKHPGVIEVYCENSFFISRIEAETIFAFAAEKISRFSS